MNKINFKEVTSETTLINATNLNLLQDNVKNELKEDRSSIVCEIEQPRPRNNKSTL